MFQTNVLIRKPKQKIEAENVYEDFYKFKYLFDFSNQPKDLKHYNNSNSLKDDAACLY